MAITGFIYLLWRTTTFSPDAPVASAVFYAGEVLGYFASLLLYFVVARRGEQKAHPATPGLKVDVLVTTYDEDIAVVRRTLIAAKAISYPHETWLLVDGNRPAFAALALDRGCHYLARADNTGAKAGNLNNALRQAKGDFVALFDADHCAEPHFLDRLLGYFGAADVAFVQTPQDYFNLGSFQHWAGRDAPLIWHEQSGFHHIEQPGREYHNSATLCGCSCVIRRCHLDLIGGFPEETVTEDMHAAVRMQKLGLRSVYHDEPLAYGIAAPDLLGFFRQRLRWGEGNMQVCRAEGLPFARDLTWRQNLCYLLLSTVYIDAWRKLVLYLAPPITILAQVPPVNGEPGEFAVYFLPYLMFGIATYYAHYGRLARFVSTEVFAMARLASGLLATWGLLRRRIPFRVSSKRLTGHNPWLCLLPALIILALCVFAIGRTAQRCFDPIVALTSSLPFWIEAVLAIFCIYHAALALGVVLRALRLTGTPELSFDHAIRLPVEVSWADGASQALWTRRLSLDRVVMRAPQSMKVGDGVEMRIYIPGRTLDVNAHVVSRGETGEVTLRPDWHHVEDRDALDQILHARRWHRVVEGRSEFAPRRYGRLSNCRTAKGVWEPMIGVSNEGARMLVYHNAQAADRQVILFGAQGLAARTVDVVASLSGHLDGQRLMHRGVPGPDDEDDSALEGVSGRRLVVRAALVGVGAPEPKTLPRGIAA